MRHSLEPKGLVLMTVDCNQPIFTFFCYYYGGRGKGVRGVKREVSGPGVGNSYLHSQQSLNKLTSK